MTSIDCPCGKTLHAEAGRAAEKMCCPDCGRVHAVPPGEGVQAAAPPRESSTAGVPPRCELPPPAATTSGLALAALLLGILSLVFGFLWGPLPAASFGGIALVAGALGLGAVFSSRGGKKGAGLAIAGMVAGLLGAVALPVGAYLVGEEAARMASSNNLKEIALCMHEYQDAFQGFPPAASSDAAGKPLLSWRVLILPCIRNFEGGPNLLAKFKLDEPWDGPNNSMLLSQMPRCYALPGSSVDPPGYTHYRVFVGHGAAFDPPAPANMSPPLRLASSFPDGMDRTILVVEAAEAVPWTKPDELDYDPDKPLPPLGGRFRGGFQVVMVDGSVHWVGSNVSEKTLRAAITRAGGETLGPDW